MVRRSGLVLAVLLAATPSFADRGPGPAPAAGLAPPTIRLAIDAEIARLTAADAASGALRGRGPAAATPNWFQRHPVATASIGGFLGGFAVGWARGDDGVFDDFTGEANGLFLGGIVAGSAASVVGIYRAIRK
jgi:hypothetical protein